MVDAKLHTKPSMLKTTALQFMTLNIAALLAGSFKLCTSRNTVIIVLVDFLSFYLALGWWSQFNLLKLLWTLFPAFIASQGSLYLLR